MDLTQKQWHRLLSVIQHLHDSLDDKAIRARAGRDLLDLLSADYFASFVWDAEAEAFGRPVYINMSPESLVLYERYYQFHDPITHKLQRLRRAASVNEVMDQRDLVNTEFFNDFLKTDGLHYGMNIHVYDNLNRDIGDFRIWRAKDKPNFGREELAILEMIAPHFRNAMRNIEFAKHNAPHLYMDEVRVYLSDQFSLTKRELDVAEALLHGSPDKIICDDLGISVPTLRSHISHVFAKSGVTNRTEFCCKALTRA